MAPDLDGREDIGSAVDHSSDAARLSKKKRKRKEKEAIEIPVDAATGSTKKKRKKKHTDASGRREPAVLPEQQSLPDEVAPPASELSGEKKKKKKKKRREEQQRVDSNVDDQIDPSLTALDKTVDANSNAFLSAIVTAANGSVEQGQSQVNDFVHQPPFENAGFQHLPPGLGGAAVSFSGEDLAHALQTLDVAKLADALKALGEAGSSTFPLPGQSINPQRGQALDTTQLVMPSNTGSTGEHGQARMPPPATANRPARNPEKQSSRRQPQAPNPSLSEDHAHLLANKWLSATKLNELSMSIGKVPIFSPILPYLTSLIRSAVQEGQVFCYRRSGVEKCD